MRPLPTTPLPPRARRRALRRARRAVVPAALTAALVAAGVTTAGVAPASAAPAEGTFTIGGAPIALNQATDPQIGTMKPSADAAQNGMYGDLADFPVLPMHAAVARNGHVISFGTPVDTVQQSGIAFDDWRPGSGLQRQYHVDTAAMGTYDSFCNANVVLPDGRMLMVSGQTQADMMSMIFDPATHEETMGANLAYRRWYVTALRLTDNRILLLGGANAGNTGAYATPGDNSGVATTPEIGTGTGGWNDLAGASSTDLFGAQDNHWWYPRAFNGPNGTVVGASGDRIWSLSTDGNGAVQQTGTLPFDPKVSGSQVMYAPGKVLFAGGGQVNNDDNVQGLANAAIVDFNGGTPTVTAADPMHFGRNWLNLTVLPTGEVFANGGTKLGTQGGDDNSVRQAEIWNPATGRWTTAATAQKTRTYHSTSMLLPSGAVFTGGSGNPGPVDNFNAELYYPAYLFKQAADGTVGWASRPAITAIAGSATYGGQVDLTIGDGRAIKSASLITLPAVTHSQNTDQRRIPLQITQQGGTVTASLPGSANTMPPGDYELSVVDADGVPSAAQVITIRRGDAGLVTVSDQSRTGAADDPGTGVNPTGGGTAEGAPAGGTGGTTTGTPAGGTPAGGTPAGSTKPVALTVDRSVGLESGNRTGQLVTESHSRAVLRKVTTKSSQADQSASSWVVRPGLASSAGVSFESVKRPGYYLLAPAKSGGQVVLAHNSGSKTFAGRATFVSTKLTEGQTRRFQVWSHRSEYLRYAGTKLIAQTLKGKLRALPAAAFKVRTGLTAAAAVPVTSGRSIGLESTAHTGALLSAKAVATTLRKATRSSSSTVRKQASWVVRKGLGSARGVSLESVDRPGWFLAAPKHGTGALVLVKRSKTVAARATFLRVSGATGHGSSFQLASRPILYVSTTRAGLGLGRVDQVGTAAVTFTVHSGLSPAPTK